MTVKRLYCPNLLLYTFLYALTRSLRGAYADETVAYAHESVYTICLLICRRIGGCTTFSSTDSSSPAFGGAGRFAPRLLSVLEKVVQPPMRLQIKRQTV